MEKEADIKEKMDTAVLEKMEIEGRGVDKTERMEKRGGDGGGPSSFSSCLR